jgi:UDP-glucuronate decarboxylase
MRADDGRVVSNAVTQALAGDDITVYGTGQQTRSFCYVDDLIDGLLRLMAYEGNYDGAINLGNSVEITVRELISHVLQLSRSDSRIVSRPLPVDDPQRRRPDISLATKLLGWKPQISLKAGLEKTIAYFSAEAAALAIPKTQANAPRRKSTRADSPPLLHRKAVPVQERTLTR